MGEYVYQGVNGLSLSRSRHFAAFQDACRDQNCLRLSQAEASDLHGEISD